MNANPILLQKNMRVWLKGYLHRRGFLSILRCHFFTIRNAIG